MNWEDDQEWRAYGKRWAGLVSRHLLFIHNIDDSYFILQFQVCLQVYIRFCSDIS